MNPRSPTADETALAPAASRALGTGVQQLGPFVILAELGRGGMGAVYRARDTRLDREVALKVLLPNLSADPKAKARFVREARAQAKVEHDHIIPIHEVEEAGGVAYIVMPLLKGQTLDAALRANPRPPLAETVRIAREIAEGLAAAHAAGLIHRDIKPANVWLEGDKRRVKILDFGLARTSADAPDESADGAPPPRATQLTAAGALVGTPAYMSPEQARSQPADHRSDVFSLGVVLYQMVTGRKPFAGGSAFEVLAAVATREAPRAGHLVPDLPPALDALIHRMLAKDPAARPHNCADVVAELDALAPPASGDAANVWEDLTTDLAGEVDTVAVRTEPGREPAGRAKWPLVAGGLALLAAVAALVALAANKVAPVAKTDEPRKADEKKGTEKKAVMPPADKNRELAKLIIEKKGGVVTDAVPGARVTKLEDLPRGRFKVTVASLHPPVTFPLTDTELDAFVGLDALEEVSIHGPHLTDAGVTKLLAQPFAPKLRVLQLAVPELTDTGAAAVANCPALTALVFYQCPKLTDAGLACLGAIPNLRKLEVNSAGFVTGSGLKHLKGENLTALRFYKGQLTDAAGPFVAQCASLADLELYGTFTDATVVPLGGLAKLQRLSVTSTGVTDRGLEALAGLPNLSEFSVSAGALSETGAAHVGRMSRLAGLSISGKLSDDGMKHLHALRFLRTCQLEYASGFSYDALRKLRTALPGCKVLTTLDGAADRKAADWVFARGGTVYAGGAQIAARANLPPAFEVTGIEVWKSLLPLAATDLAALRDCDRIANVLALGPGIDDAGLKALAGFAFAPKVRILVLENAALTGDGLAALAAFKTVSDLRVTGPAFAGGGLDVCAALPNLTQLTLSHTKVADDHLKPLRGPKLTHLDLVSTAVTDAGLEHLTGLSQLTHLRLISTGVTDAGLEKLVALTNLIRLDVSGTKVTRAGAEKLFAALPNCKIAWNGGTLEPKAPAPKP